MTTLNVKTPISIGNINLKNRLVMAPMQQNQGTAESMATDYHADFYGSRAQHLGLVIIESTAIAENGRLYPDDIGIFNDQHIAPLKKVTEAVHTHGTPVFIQLSHGGRKSSPDVIKKLTGSGLVGASPLAYNEEHGTPEELTLSGIQEIIEQFRSAARRSVEAGFDGIEVHAAHGFLIHQFLSPLSNKRTDAYGGSLENRTRFLKEVLVAIREEVGSDYPVIIRVSATDYVDGGLYPKILGEILQGMESYLDAVHVSTGALTPDAPSDIYTAYQVPHAAIIKQYVNLPVIAVGNIHNRSLADHILEDRLADIIAIGRPLLADANYASKLID